MYVYFVQVWTSFDDLFKFFSFNSKCWIFSAFARTHAHARARAHTHTQYWHKVHTTHTTQYIPAFQNCIQIYVQNNQFIHFINQFFCVQQVLINRNDTFSKKLANVHFRLLLFEIIHICKKFLTYVCIYRILNAWQPHLWYVISSPFQPL